MPVLLLAQGDPEAKNLLRHAIEARYGLQPPAITSLRIDFKGRARAKIGPVTTWVPVNSTAYFHFPEATRWDFTVQPMGLPIRRGIEAFDGSTYRSTRGTGEPTAINDDEQIHSQRRRLWAMAALLLTPLGEHFVKLTFDHNQSFTATNTQINDTVLLTLRENNTLERVEVDCLNTETQKEQRFSLQLSEEQTMIDQVMLPQKISAFWDDTVFYEINPIKAEVNPDIPAAVFTLEQDIE